MRTLALLLVLALLAVHGVHAAQTTGPYHMGSWEDQLLLFLEGTSPTAPLLSANPNAGNSNVNLADAVAGITGLPNAFSSTRPAPLEFKLDSPLPHPVYLNLTKPVVGALYFQSASSTATSREAMTIIVELWVAGKLAGGDTFVYAASVVTQPWVPMYFHFRPEFRMIEPGDAVSVKVYRMSGATDLVIGTTGAQQSYVELRYFPVDPLSGALYIEGKKLTIGATSPAAGEETSAPNLGIPLLLVALPAAFRRGRAAHVAAFVLLVGFAGCLGGSDAPTDLAEDSDKPKPTAVLNQTDDEGLRMSGRGAIEGYVTDGDNLGLPVKKAHIALLGTNRFTSTDNRGHFLLDALDAATYKLRVDAPSFQSFEQDVDVVVGVRSWVNVTIVRPTVGNDQTRAHPHDLWGDDVTRRLFEADTPLKSYPSSAASGTGNWFLNGYSTTDTPIPVPAETLVLPGAVLLELTLDWTVSGNAPKELMLRVKTPGNKTETQFFVPRGPKVPFRIAFFPNEADTGHQTGTDWEFYIRLPAYWTTNHPIGQPYYAGGPIHVAATIQKGVIPLEPPHRTFWNGASELPIIPRTDRTAGTVCCTPPYYPYSAWSMPAGLFVPPGTKEVQGTFDVNVQASTQGQPSPYPWKLIYRSADSTPSSSWKVVTLTSAGTGKYSFVLPVDAKMVDQYYQSKSKWVFGVDDDMPAEGRPLVYPNHGYSTHWILSATAVRDPAYMENAV